MASLIDLQIALSAQPDVRYDVKPTGNATTARKTLGLFLTSLATICCCFVIPSISPMLILFMYSSCTNIGSIEGGQSSIREVKPPRGPDEFRNTKGCRQMEILKEQHRSRRRAMNDAASFPPRKQTLMMPSAGWHVHACACAPNMNRRF